MSNQSEMMMRVRYLQQRTGGGEIGGLGDEWAADWKDIVFGEEDHSDRY